MVNDDNIENVKAFNRLLGKKKEGVAEIHPPRSYVPKPDEDDYQNRWIMRHFVRKVNDSSAPILEVDKNQFDALEGNDYYLTASIRWTIFGDQEIVRQTNLKVLQIADTEIPGMLNRLPNLLQYCRES